MLGLLSALDTNTMDKTRMKRGLLYIVIGNNSAREAILSLRSARRFHPSVSACARHSHVTDIALRDTMRKIFTFNKRLNITNVYPKKSSPITCDRHRFMSMRAKSRMLLMSPFEETLFLDTDTYVNSKEFMIPFSYLNKHDLLCTRAMGRKFHRYCSMMPKAVKDGLINKNIDHYGSGVVYFKKTERVRNLGLRWNKLWIKHRFQCPPDQMSFSLAIYRTGFTQNMEVLPLHYNTTVASYKECGENSIIFHYQRPSYMMHFVKRCHLNRNKIINKILSGP